MPTSKQLVVALSSLAQLSIECFYHGHNKDDYKNLIDQNDYASTFTNLKSFFHDHLS